MLDSDHIIYLGVVLALYIAYKTGRKRLFTRKHTNITFANVEWIKLQCIDELYSPEVLIEYSFFSDAGKKFTGKDYLRIDTFLEDSLLVLNEERGMPVLSTNEGKYTGEEVIEHYLLSHKRSILVEYYTKNPSENRIYHPGPTQAETSWKRPSFPWM